MKLPKHLRYLPDYKHTRARVPGPQVSAVSSRNLLRGRSLSFPTAILTLLVCVMLLGLTTWREWVARNVQMHEVNTALVNLASSLSQHAEDTVEVADTALIGIIARLETDGISPTALERLDRLLLMRSAALPRVRDFVVFGEDGSWLATSMPAKGGNNADRSYFQHHRDVSDHRVYIGTPFRSRSNGRWTVAVTRRFEYPNGRFAGVVMATIDMSYFVDHYATFKLGGNGTVLLLTTTGTLLARYPFEERAMGQDFSNREIFKNLQRRSVGNYDGVAGIDGVKRVVGFRQSERYPLVVTVGVSEEEALQAWSSDAFLNLTLALGGVGLVLILSWYLTRQIRNNDVSGMRLRESETRYRLLANNTSDAITCLSLDSKQTYVSPAHCEIFGYKPDEVLGQPMTAGVHPDDLEDIRTKMQPLILGENDRTQITYRMHHKQGHWIWSEGSLSLVRDESTGLPASMICSVRNISERHAQADELHRTNTELERLARHLTRARDQAEQASRAKTRFLAGMSHELRTPLNGIMGYAQLLHMEGGLNAVQVTRVDAMLGAGAHLLEMINSVLDLSQIESERLEIQAAEVDLHAVAAACLDLVRPAAEAKQLALGFVAAPEVPRRVMTDPGRLRQVLLNLLGNAVKFTAAGSVDLHLEANADRTRLLLKVVDTGPGIPPGRIHQLFQDFQRLGADARKVEGAGVGLALSARLATLMGGTLSHQDSAIGGSVFWLDIPLLAPSVGPELAALTNSIPGTRSENASAQPAFAERSLRILVVDDVAMNRDIASSFLRFAGHQVACAEDGAQGAEAAKASDFDIILMDVRMPGVDGLEATRRIRSLAGPRGRVPIVALTAQAFTEQVEECRRAGMNSHLAKPFTLETLRTAVAHATATATDVFRNGDQITAAGSLSVIDKASSFANVTAGLGLELPILDHGAFGRTTSYLAPEGVSKYMQTLAEQCEALLRRLRDPDDLRLRPTELAVTAHTLAGSAGMFGFRRLADVALRFEHTIAVGAPGTLVLIDELVATIRSSLDVMVQA